MQTDEKHNDENEERSKDVGAGRASDTHGKTFTRAMRTVGTTDVDADAREHSIRQNTREALNSAKGTKNDKLVESRRTPDYITNEDEWEPPANIVITRGELNTWRSGNGRTGSGQDSSVQRKPGKDVGAWRQKVTKTFGVEASETRLRRNTDNEQTTRNSQSEPKWQNGTPARMSHK
ncbi:hypothetical protein R1flu_025100 [Riccia fluitans]|uniref:Uncharacterized protein n=1 Tax=Riccia fluitans TaxID=41844 RepID=A0ABD1Y0X4_9MARC